MFGPIGKPLWSRYAKADAENRIPLVLRALLLRFPDTLVLVEAGMGDAIGAEEAQVLGIGPPRGSLVQALAQVDVAPDEIEHLILTHLHYDHVAGIAGRDGHARLLPRAKIYVQKAQWDAALNPGAFEKASFRPADLELLRGGALELLDGETEIHPGLEVRTSDGHTRGLQIVVVRGGAQTIYYPSDLIPTLAHVRTDFTTCFDLWPDRLVGEKVALLEEIAARDAILVFVHDPRTAAGRIGKCGAEFSVTAKIDL